MNPKPHRGEIMAEPASHFIYNWFFQLLFVLVYPFYKLKNICEFMNPKPHRGEIMVGTVQSVINVNE